MREAYRFCIWSVWEKHTACIRSVWYCPQTFYGTISQFGLIDLMCMIYTVLCMSTYSRDRLKILSKWVLKYKGKKIQISIHIVLKNYKYTKSLFLNTLRCNHLSKKTKQKQNNVFFFNTRMARSSIFLSLHLK